MVTQALPGLSLLFILGFDTPVHGADPAAPDPQAPVLGPPIQTADALWSIPAAEQDLPHQADLEITALYYDPVWQGLLWGTDRTGRDAYFRLASGNPRLRPGQHFLVTGPFVPAQGLPLATAKITLLPDPAPRRPLPTRGHFLDAGAFNGHLVAAEAYVNSQAEVDPEHLYLELDVEGHRATARVLTIGRSPVPQVKGAFIRLTGVYIGDPASASAVPNIWVPGPEDVQILTWLDRDPRFALPATPIDRLSYASGDMLVRVIGEVQSQKLGENVVLRDATGQVTLLSAMMRPLQAGDRVEAIGYPDREAVTLLLRQSYYRTTAARPPAATLSRGLPLLRLAEQVRRLEPSEAARGYEARLSGVVTWSHPAQRTICLLDASGGIAVLLPPGFAEPPVPGTLIDITGHSVFGGFAPALQAGSLSLSSAASLPKPQAITLDQALSGAEESQWVTMGGFARTVQRGTTWDRFTISTPTGEFVAVAPSSPRSDSLAGAVLQLTGVCRATTDEDHQLTGVELWVSGDEEIVVTEPKPIDPFAGPERSIASLRRFQTLDAFNHLVHLGGIVVHAEPGAYLNLQDGDQSLLVWSRDPAILHAGDRVEVVGFPGRQARRLVLRESHFRRTGHGSEPLAVSVASPATLLPELDGRLVRLKASISEITDQAAGSLLVCQTPGSVFETTWAGRTAGLPSGLAPGCLAELTGVYVVQFDQNSQPRSFQLKLRSARDMAVLLPAPWWTVGRAEVAVGSLAVAILLGLAWVYALRRRVRRQTAEIRTQLEKSSRLEAELVRSSKLESLGVLAGGIAHDFNNLLSVILGNLSLVLEDRDLPPGADRFLRQSERATFRARDLTQQLLTFAKGGAPVLNAAVLPEIVREAVDFALHGSAVRSAFAFSGELWPAHVDRGQISQVVHNIVLNARHAMPAGGVIHIALANEEITPGGAVPVAPGRYLRLEIRDEGCGIDPKNLSRIFDPYFTTKQKGSGLGLATAYSIVKKHSGHISVASQPGHGTTFRIWLPAAAIEPDARHDGSNVLPRLSGRALIMDDEVDIRTMAAAMLQRLGLDVTTTSDGTELVTCYRAALTERRPFSVVIVDLTVPGAMGGAEAIAELQKIDPAVRAVVSSGYSTDPVMANFQQYGFLGRIPKPYQFEQFVETIAAVLDGRDSPVPASPAVFRLA